MISRRLARAACCVLFIFIVATSALPQKGATTALSPSSEHSPPEVVAWESIFWGLFALAIHAMSVPSSHDLTHRRNTSALLYPLRSSPLVCLADSLEILISLFLLVFLKKRSFTGAASASRPGLDEQFKHNMQRRPIMALFWCLGTATQLVKIFGFQGSQLWWVKVAAAFYLGSWILIVFVSLLPPDDAYKIDMLHADQEYLKKSFNVFGLVYLHVIAHTLHAQILFYAMFEVNHTESTKGMLPDETNFKYWVRALIEVVAIPPVGIVLSAIILFYFGIFCSLIIPFVSETRASMKRRAMVGRVVIASVMLGCVPLILRNILVMYELLLVASTAFVQGGGQIIMIWTCLAILNTASGLLIKRVVFLRKMRALRFDELVIYGFACANLVVICLYCAFEYDPEGTIKPTWTEKLG